MRHRRLIGGWLTGAWLATLMVAPVPVAANDGFSAVLGGAPITLAEAAQLSCHDLEYPVLTCFTTSDAMQADVNRRTGGSMPRVAIKPLSVTILGYVTAYANQGFSGASVSLAHDYADLGAIGWNNRISSFISHGAGGAFYDLTSYYGTPYYFGATTSVSYVGGAYNDTFSSIDINGV